MHHLQEVGISYVFAGKDALDVRLALHKLKTIFGIDTLMITGGGIVNRSFLQAGMIGQQCHYFPQCSLFLPIHGGSSFGRSLHMLSAYWGC